MKMRKLKTMLFLALSAVLIFSGCSYAPVQSREELQISVFAKFVRNVAKERSVTLSEAADMLYDLGVRGFDAGPDEKDLGELCATKLKPINFYYFPDWFPERKGSASKTTPAECLAMAKRYGVERIMVVPPNFTSGKDNPAEFEETVVRMREFVRDAKKQGITVTVEDFGGTGNPCSYAKYLKRFLDEIPDLKFALDSGNLYYAGRGEDICEFLDYARGRIAHVHLKDQLPTNNRAYATLGTGAVPNERIVRTVDASGYSGWYTLENTVGDTYDDTVKQVKVLKTWLGGK
jgi:sugar phosphate isomerase/epimerase